MKRVMWLMPLCLAACFPAMSLRGRVSDVPELCHAQGEVVGSAKPIQNAAVTLVCPGEAEPVMRAESDAEGRFAVSKPGTMDSACAVHVDKPGYETRTFAVADLCADGGMLGGCHALSLRVELGKER
jgi:hypothetical protein